MEHLCASLRESLLTLACKPNVRHQLRCKAPSTACHGWTRVSRWECGKSMLHPLPAILWQLGEGFSDGGEELLGFGFLISGAALVVLKVAQGGLGVGLRALQQVALTG